MSEEVEELPEPNVFQELLKKDRISKLTFILNEDELDAFYQVVTVGAVSSHSSTVAVKLSTPEYDDEVPPGQVFEDHFILVLEEPAVDRFIKWATVLPPSSTTQHPFPDLPAIIRRGLTRGAAKRD